METQTCPEEDESKIGIRDDMPRHMYTEWKDISEDIDFISAVYELDDILSDNVAAKCECEISSIRYVQITRSYDGEYKLHFPDYIACTEIQVEIVHDIISTAKEEIGRLEEVTDVEAEESEETDTSNDTVETAVGIKDTILKTLDKILSFLKKKDVLCKEDFKAIELLYPIELIQLPNSEIYPAFLSVQKAIEKAFSKLDIKTPTDIKGIHSLIVSEMPSFVYYSDYGNLDAEIYLPQAVRLLGGNTIAGFDNAAKIRTLRMLFEFVNLNPNEILELGKDPLTEKKVVTITKTINNHSPHLTKTEESEEIIDFIPDEVEIKEGQKNKSERKIQLNSAASNFTRKFKDWWRQGDYTFEFDADGDYFKIWVSDKIRPDKIELRQRSTGLQWFFSFFLVFLVESKDAHKGTILLLDEAGLTLHPLAQKDLVAFFENLAEENQIIHTTHSPFLIDTNNIDRVKVVYVDKDGYTVSSDNLREGITPENRNSIYAAHAALGLSVSDIILQGCQPIIVEGTSDQYLLNAIKLYLIQNHKISPDKELVFVPAGGTSTKGVQGIIGILGGKNEELPPVLLDSDLNGENMKKNLSSGLYKEKLAKRIISATDITGIDCSEVEDIIPYNLMNKEIERLLRNDDDLEFEDSYSDGEPILPQIEKFATDNSIVLPSGWKVELARKVKVQLLKTKVKIDNKYVQMWSKLFGCFIDFK